MHSLASLCLGPRSECRIDYCSIHCRLLHSTRSLQRVPPDIHYHLRQAALQKMDCVQFQQQPRDLILCRNLLINQQQQHYLLPVIALLNLHSRPQQVLLQFEALKLHSQHLLCLFV
jgi:hypothetical protein